MKKTGAELVTYALEELGISYTFGIPGVHNTELYDALGHSPKITPILVTHEGCGAFMADAVSRTSNSVGTLVIVPAAGVTHAMSGIGEAFLAGIPLLIICSGIRRDVSWRYQLHECDLQTLVSGITKKSYLIENHASIISTLYEAFLVATSGEPGPVFVEIPANILLFKDEGVILKPYLSQKKKSVIDFKKIKKAAQLLKEAKHPGILVGWGGKEATGVLGEIAETLNAPVATTLQGLSCFPADNPLHTGMGFGNYAVPAAEKAFENCDCLLAIGTRFAEIPTGSFGMPVPTTLIHIDINPAVFDKNYPATVSIEGDATAVLEALLQILKADPFKAHEEPNLLKALIAREKLNYESDWLKHESDAYVNPMVFFQHLRALLLKDAIVVCDDGNHTFLTAELFPFYQSKTFISPSDFNCMGYAVPAAIGAKLANPTRQVFAVVGDGAFLMTGLEIITAVTLKLGVIFCVFHDGELSQISQGQKIPYHQKTCTELGKIDLEGMAKAVGAAYLYLEKNAFVPALLKSAETIASTGKPVIVDVNIDYSKPTRFTQGVVKTNLARFPFSEKIRFIQRAILRKVF